MEILAVIPARGGSVRLPGKNIKNLNGKPLIAYTIECWQKSKYFKESALVSSDSDEILAIAWKYNARILKRPGYLSQGDLAGPHVLLKHIIDNLAKYYQYRAGVIVILQPTSPLRLPSDIDACLDLYFSGKGDSVTSVCKGKENGAVYVTHAELINQGSIYGKHLLKYEMPEERSVDIDTLEDFEKAERILKGEEVDNTGHLHELARPERSKGTNKGSKRMRGRPGKRAVI